MTWLDDLISLGESQIGNRQRGELWARGVSDEQIALYRIGYLDKKLSPSCPTEFIEWSLHGNRLNDVFVFPLTNVLGQIRGVQFRHVEKAAKGYLDYFLAPDELTLFGLGQAIPHMWKTRTIWLVEGVYDLYPIQRVYPQVFATMTASVTQDIIRVLRRFVDVAWVGYDNDKPGANAVAKVAKEENVVKIRSAIPPKIRKVDGSLTKDYSDLWEVWGDQRLGVYLNDLR